MSGGGGIPPLRDRRLAAGFIVVMYTLVGATVAGLLAAVLSHNSAAEVVAGLLGGALGAALALWRIRRTPEEERADDGGY